MGYDDTIEMALISSVIGRPPDVNILWHDWNAPELLRVAHNFKGWYLIDMRDDKKLDESTMASIVRRGTFQQVLDALIALKAKGYVRD